MEIYCFPDPENPQQVRLFSVSFLVRKFLLLHMEQRKRSSKQFSLRCMIGRGSYWQGKVSLRWKLWTRKVQFLISYFFSGRNMEQEIGKVLGLTFGEKTKGTVKPLYFSVFLRLLLGSRWRVGPKPISRP